MGFLVYEQMSSSTCDMQHSDINVSDIATTHCSNWIKIIVLCHIHENTSKC